MIHLMRQQVKNPPAPLTPSELNEVGDALNAALSELAAIGIPDVIGHSDFNPGNILLRGNRSVFIDWSAAHVGSPWLTLEYLIAHFRKSGSALPGHDALLRDIFREQWIDDIPYDALREAQELAPLVAVFASAVADDSWRNPVRLALPGVSGYLRSLARIMRGEVQALNARRQHA
jgi:thiamine kinase-like enzyme